MPSISNQSIVVIDPYRSLYISFQPECLHVLLVHCNPFLMSFNLQRFSQCSLFLFSNGVFSTSFISVVFFSQNGLTSQGSLVSLVCQRSNLVLPLLFPFCFPSGAILDLGTRSSRSGGVLWRPKTGASDAFQGFRVSSCYLFGSLHSSLHHVHCIMSSCHFFFLTH